MLDNDDNDDAWPIKAKFYVDEKYRSWMLANPLFVGLICIRPGAYFYILGESGVSKSYETSE